MIAIARNATSILGLSMNHSSCVGLRRVTVMAPLGQFLMRLAHRLQSALESMVRGKENSGHPGTSALPLKQTTREVQVLQISWFARSEMPAVRE